MTSTSSARATPSPTRASRTSTSPPLTIQDTWHLLQFPSYQELSDALEEGVVDAMVLDGAIAKTYMDDKRTYIENFEVAEQSFDIATQKGSDLSEPVATAMQDMLDDGTIAALVDKWD